MTQQDFPLLKGNLIHPPSFKDTATIDDAVPDSPGLYCIRIKDASMLPSPFGEELKKRGHDIVYIGIASKSLKTRFLKQELRAKGHGTFFRSLGAILGFLPPKGSLSERKNKRNYKFSKADETRIIKWINTHLKVNWVVCEKELGSIEDELVKEYLPLLNLAKNPKKMRELSALRERCVGVANGNS